MEVIFIRHGEPDYSEPEKRGFIGHGCDLAPLTEKGIAQIKAASLDPRLIGAELLVASAYTRTMQSAAIISKKLDEDIVVEVGLHEWLPDKTFMYASKDELRVYNKDFLAHNGIYKTGDEKWEEWSSVRRRVDEVLGKYKNYNKIIVVCHEYLIRSITGMEQVEKGEIVEYTY